MAILRVFLAFLIHLLVLVRLLCAKNAAEASNRVDFYNNQNCTQYLLQQERHLLNHTITKESTCPPWYYLDQQGSCQETPTPEGILLYGVHTGQVWLHEFYCMTTNYSSGSRVDEFGACFALLSDFHITKIPLPCNISELNEFTCGGYNREGQLCGRCIDGYAPLVYSYSFSCVNCTTEYGLNWVKYVGMAFGPLTLFCLFICFFHISATSPYHHGFVFFCQIVTAPNVMRLMVSGRTFQSSVNHDPLWGELYISLVSVWNLDFFVNFYQPICLHPHMTSLQALALGYLVALYPLLLLVLVLVLVKLHGNDVRVVVFLWKPFHICIRPFLRNFDIQASLIESFATLFFLSAMKIQSVSTDLLAATEIHYLDYFSGSIHKQLHVYFAADIAYFGSGHWPYALLAIFFLITFLVIPTLLLFLYPFRFFQQFLNRINCNSIALRTFMDVFQGNYKDGTENTRDFRFFSGIFFCARFLISESFLLINSPLYLMFSGTLLTMLGFSVAITHPQRRYTHYILDSLILMIFSLLLFTLIGESIEHNSTVPNKIEKMFLTITVLLPLVYIVGLVTYWVTVKKRLPKKIARIIQKKLTKQSTNHDLEQAHLLPH